MAMYCSLVGVDMAKIGVGSCMKNKWLSKAGDLLIPTVSDVVDTAALLLQKVSLNVSGQGVDLSSSEEDLKNLKKRKLVQQVALHFSHLIAMQPKLCKCRSRGSRTR